MSIFRITGAEFKVEIAPEFPRPLRDILLTMDTPGLFQVHQDFHFQTQRRLTFPNRQSQYFTLDLYKPYRQADFSD